jgi:DNA-binding CsgD family transcriptional regulator
MSSALLKEFSESFKLTPRETELLRLMIERVVDSKEIATHLGISTNTVNNHLKSIFQVKVSMLKISQEYHECW